MSEHNYNKAYVLKRYNLNNSSLTTMVKEGLPHFYQGRQILFPKLELEKWMDSQQAKINALKQGMRINNNTLTNIFRCSPQGGMRRSRRTNTLVLIAKRTNDIYLDSWKGDTLHYTGMGQKGDQNLTGNQNITLYESDTNNVNVHLFEIEKPQEYIYMGKIKLASAPYQAVENDVQNRLRSVWKFPIRVIE